MRTSFLLLALSCGSCCAHAWDLRYGVVPLETERSLWVVFTSVTDISDAGGMAGLVHNRKVSPAGAGVTTVADRPSSGFVVPENRPEMSDGGCHPGGRR